MRFRTRPYNDHPVHKELLLSVHISDVKVAYVAIIFGKKNPVAYTATQITQA